LPINSWLWTPRQALSLTYIVCSQVGWECACACACVCVCVQTDLMYSRSGWTGGRRCWTAPGWATCPWRRGAWPCRTGRRGSTGGPSRHTRGSGPHWSPGATGHGISAHIKDLWCRSSWTKPICYCTVTLDRTVSQNHSGKGERCPDWSEISKGGVNNKNVLIQRRAHFTRNRSPDAHSLRAYG
jgi:hypothetical protein